MNRTQQNRTEPNRTEHKHNAVECELGITEATECKIADFVRISNHNEHFKATAFAFAGSQSLTLEINMQNE